MANAAAKKSTAARESAAKTYLPIVIALNVVYLVLRLYNRDTLTKFHVFMTALLLALSFASYIFILDAHANHSSVSKKGEPLAGGASLDLLGLVVVVQYGSVLMTDKFYFLLLVIPIYGGWKLYSTFFGGSGGLAGMMPKSQPEITEASGDSADGDKAAEKRKKRAEKRRQKYA